MSIQITVRLPEEQVTYLDLEVAEGRAPSRAAAIAQALRREQRRQRAEVDLATMARAGEDPDLKELHDWATHRSYPNLD